MYERFLTEAARIEHRHALERTAARGWLLPAKPSTTKERAARIRARRRRGHNPVELVTQATTPTASAAAPALDALVATTAHIDPVTGIDADTDVSSAEPGEDRVGALVGEDRRS